MLGMNAGCPTRNPGIETLQSAKSDIVSPNWRLPRLTFRTLFMIMINYKASAEIKPQSRSNRICLDKLSRMRCLGAGPLVGPRRPAKITELRDVATMGDPVALSQTSRQCIVALHFPANSRHVVASSHLMAMLAACNAQVQLPID